MSTKEFEKKLELANSTLEDLNVEELTRRAMGFSTASSMVEVSAQPVVNHYVAPEHVRFTLEAPHIEAARQHMEQPEIAATMYTIQGARSAAIGVTLHD